MRTAIIAIAKNENLYIREWVEWHKSIGFDRIYIGDNNETDGERVADAIGDYIESGYVRKTDLFGLECYQIPYHTMEISTISGEYDWVAFVDIDEFIRLDGFRTIGEFLSQYKFNECREVLLYWRTYTDGGMLDAEDGNYSVTRFTEWKDREEVEGKPLLNMSVFKGMAGVSGMKKQHGYDKRDPSCLNAEGVPLYDGSVQRPAVYSGAWIDHYATKTCGEYIRQKYFRGDVFMNELSRTSAGFFFTINEKTAEKAAYMEELIKELSGKHGGDPHKTGWRKFKTGRVSRRLRGLPVH